MERRKKIEMKEEADAGPDGSHAGKSQLAEEGSLGCDDEESPSGPTLYLTTKTEQTWPTKWKKRLD